MNSEENNLSHAEQLLRKGENYKTKVRNLREQKYQEEVKGCTFVPKTNIIRNKDVKSRLFNKSKFDIIFSKLKEWVFRSIW